MSTSLQRIVRARLIFGIATVATICASPSIAAQGGQAAPLSDTVMNAVLEHVDEAEEVLESLLELRPVITAVTDERSRSDPPSKPRTTLISVHRSDVQKLVSLLDAAAAMVPPPPHADAQMPRGDARAHIEKAQEIAREFTQTASTPRPVGTSGGADDLVTIDRSALKRLEVELDAIELVAR